ncbi:helix-turn-helix domain-containing protein [Streptomyces sp. JV176]|uniref:helix-turn-helix domain-containing protein n=1 Tax=Streptomyces sp. JV176 TaxID=858630 RepID=UPI002E7A2F17|nr:helix-turn-helix domain-containing protein [Streptomyces sp. JV176]MEE1803459.1 helix-turn-helix domain-containing protein [Streptomyces sp. JV176]
MYQERASRLDGAIVWTGTTAAATTGPGSGPGPAPYPVLPDGCMDLLWIGGRLLVAGPDTRAYTPEGVSGLYCAGVRFAPGTAPALLGVPAHELRDRRVELADLWSPAKARALTDLTARVAATTDPATALETAALRCAAASGPPDPLLRAVVTGLDAGRTVAVTADAVGLGARQLHRRSLDAFGYGPKTLARVLRLQRALELVRRGVPYADAALAAGCADQAHLARETRALAGLTLRAYERAYAASARGETPQPSGSRTTA